MNRRHFIELGATAVAAATLGFLAAPRGEPLRNDAPASQAPPSNAPDSTPKPSDASPKPSPTRYRHYTGCGGSYEDDNPESKEPPMKCGMARVSPKSHSFLQNLLEQRRAT